MLSRYSHALAHAPRNARLYLVAESAAAAAGGAIAAVFNLYVRALGLDAGFLGTLLTATGAGAAVGVLAGGRLTDRAGARTVLLASSVVTAAGVAVQLFVWQAPALVAAGAVAGFGGAAYYVAAAPFLARNTGVVPTDDLFSLDAALVLGCTALGTAVGGQAATALLGAGFAPLTAYWATLIGAALVGSTSFGALALTREGTAAGGTPVSAPAARGANAPSAASVVRRQPAGRAAWLDVMRDPSARRLAVCAALVSAGAGLFAPYVNLFFVEELGATPAVYGWLSATATATRLAATLVAPALAARMGAAGAIGWSQLVSVPLLLTVGFGPVLAIAGAAFLVRGALMNMAEPLHVSFRMAVLPVALHGVGNSFVVLADQLTRVASTWAGGQLIERVGYRPPYAATAVCYVVSALLFLWWFGGRRTSTAPTSWLPDPR